MAFVESLLQGSLYDILFKQILGLSQCTGMGKYQFGCLTGDIAHDFLFGLFLPHIVILIFLYLFSDWAHLRTRHHAGLGTLLGIGAYIFIIYIGWYSIIALWGMWWLAVGIVLGFFNFLWTRVIHPTKTGEVMKGAKNLGEKIGESMGASKKLRILKNRKTRLQKLKQQAKTSDTRKEYAKRLAEVNAKIDEIRG